MISLKQGEAILVGESIVFTVYLSDRPVHAGTFLERYILLATLQGRMEETEFYSAKKRMAQIRYKNENQVYSYC